MRDKFMKNEIKSPSPPCSSMIEYIFVAVLVAAVITVALITLGERRENYNAAGPGVQETEQKE